VQARGNDIAIADGVGLFRTNVERVREEHKRYAAEKKVTILLAMVFTVKILFSDRGEELGLETDRVLSLINGGSDSESWRTCREPETGARFKPAG
jgi:hypothetical protein